MKCTACGDPILHGAPYAVVTRFHPPSTHILCVECDALIAASSAALLHMLESPREGQRLMAIAYLQDALGHLAGTHG